MTAAARALERLLDAPVVRERPVPRWKRRAARARERRPAAAARSTAKPSIASTSAAARSAADAGARPDRKHARPPGGRGGPVRASARRAWRARRAGRLRVASSEIAVDGLGAEHERSGLEARGRRRCRRGGAPRARRARARAPSCARPRPARRRSIVSRRAQRRGSLDEPELELRGGDDEHRLDGRRAQLRNAFVPAVSQMRADTGAPCLPHL